ncbi:hypothetical protein BDM02DRAFT_395747 [Thelephora ganbajun]|uniref:Uncharacterized protein n=1 Tax=Thelephora ganbajun TaxID=370292 RepID=A0ACB6Z9L4_THEGA|nr:hypothetical protein BDM02DRAFT_395747 [Thelephora ganbajun]
MTSPLSNGRLSLSLSQMSRLLIPKVLKGCDVFAQIKPNPTLIHRGWEVRPLAAFVCCKGHSQSSLLNPSNTRATDQLVNVQHPKIDSLSLFIANPVRRLRLNGSPLYVQNYASPLSPAQPSCATLLQRTDCCVQRTSRWKFPRPKQHHLCLPGCPFLPLEEYFDITQEIKEGNGSLALTHRWNLRETDLRNYTLSFREIDKVRVDGTFVDLEKNVRQGHEPALEELMQIICP